MRAAVAAPDDVLLATALHWYAIALEFRPDVILELGRGYGNSTTILTEAANAIGARVYSFDLHDTWTRRTQVEAVAGTPWFDRLSIISGDLTKHDLASYAGARTMVLWDAHGFAIAEAVLARLLPAIAHRPHLVVCHDIADNRYSFTEREYGGRPIWQGMEDYYRSLQAEPRAFFNLGWACGAVDQVIPILDFCWRNRIDLHSADHELSQTSIPAIPDFEPPVSVAWFTLNEATMPFHFPAITTLTPPSEADDLRASTSWRITAPLRWLARKVRGIR